MKPEQIKISDLPDAEKPDPTRFFNNFVQSFQKAAEKSGSPIYRSFLIGGQIIRLRFAGPALVPLITPALEHLAADESADPDLTICIWDNASTTTARPQLPPAVAMPRGDIPGYVNDRIYSHLGADFFSILDAKRGLAVYWCSDAAQLPLYERGAPLRSILHWWLRRASLQLVHAGAVGTSEGGVLLAGKGGSGKSTTCLACLHAGLLYISDDYSLIGLGPEPHVHSIYNTAKLQPDNLFRMPQMGDKINNVDHLQTEKALFFLQQYFPENIASSMPLKAILLPRVSGREDTRLRQATARDSLSALLLSTMHQLAGSNERTVDVIKQLVDILPSFHLELGTDLQQIPVIIRDLLNEKRQLAAR